MENKMSEITLIEAAKEVIEEDPRTEEQENLWLYLVSVVRKMGGKIYMTFSKDLPSPESIIKVRRDILNASKNKERFSEIRKPFQPEENTSYEPPPAL